MTAAGGRLAVLMATYNGAQFIDEQLRSIDQQTWPAIDVWASDDGSTDGTAAALERWAAYWSKGRFTRIAGPSRGFSANFRSLLTNPAVDADYVAFCDQDDVWLAEKTQVAVAALAAHGCRPALYCARTIITDADGQDVARSPLFRRPPDFANALVQNIGGGNTMVLNRAAHELLRQAAERTDFISHDWFAYLIVAGAGGHVTYDEVPHVRYRQHGKNLVGSNKGWAARVARVKAAFRGRFTLWNDGNFAALDACRGLLTPAATQVFDQFRQARSGPLPGRLVSLWRSGVYRQTALGQVSLYAAGLLGKL
jgi:glycosyltransferase involved in cell wall biosynthesis